MITIAQRIEALRVEKGLSRPALAAALGLPRMSVEKFETGRQTPSQDQQAKLAQYFGVSLAYLRGESDDPSGTDSWLSGNVADEPAVPRPVPKAAPRPAAQVVQSSGGDGDGAVFSALLKSKSFQDMVRSTVLEVLRSPEGQQLLAKAIRKELGR
ncbi:helix-turn-helix transcriptional regulator [Oscillibacter valericigenes]|uniref:helix-turn-helix domain-containing protein n=1 Tax=Oscillibacter valericigenes TaxID=351091 RepID=UPI001F353277|nr:helix-turn-helix transcriptional regulator [Oscillibacter valericigenes]MCF2615683.1 helix-turn-helix transcriptional regulator [Oscillibacter valericigenes]